ncbi:HIT domain-containing protein, partial [Verrucomicrobiota bacterium]
VEGLRNHFDIRKDRHVDSLETMNEKELVELMSLASTACAALRKTMDAGGFNLGINLGTPAGAGLKDHVHMHLVPRWDGDTNFMPVLSDIKVIPQSLDELWEKLDKALKA